MKPEVAPVNFEVLAHPEAAVLAEIAFDQPQAIAFPKNAPAEPELDV